MKPEIVQVATISEIFQKMQQHDRADAALYRVNGAWKPLSAQDMYQRIRNTARTLERWGIGRGERIAVIGENRPEWAIVDFAATVTGLVDVPVYPTQTPEQMGYILHDSGCRAAFVSTREQYEKVRSVRDKTSLEHVVVYDDIDEPDAQRMSRIALSEPYARDAEFDAIVATMKPGDLATIIYTSGTTGTPKGVMLTHGNIAANVSSSCAHYEWPLGGSYISFLPLSHITARHVDYIMYARGVSIAYCPSFDDVSRSLAEIRPHHFVSVPRVYEKIRQEAERRAGHGLRKMVFDWALRVGRKHRDEIIVGKRPQTPAYKLADTLVFSKIRQALGGNIREGISGGAPLGVDTANWFADVGIRIFEGYGLTETSPVIALNTMSHYKIGTVGRPLPNVEVKVAEDGELLTRGPSVTQGYWNMPEETRNAFVDGWFRTGDIAEIDADGFIKITDRKKDLLKTSGGKFIAPQPIENALKGNVLVAHAAVIGDKRKYPAVIIAPHFALLEDWARVNNVPFHTHEDLIHSEKVRALYEGIVADLNSRLAHFERLKRLILVPDEFTVTSGELTPSLKLKRRVVEKKYATLIEALYAEPAPEMHPTR
ncbi:MAG: long-chain fatty acid--CoA ligase [Acidobacteriales bacterium]|nr:long-chain fatty acid--CoA ligase [Terriglobales bacterium]